MIVAHLLMWGSMLVFGSSAILALVWAIRTGQMSGFTQGASSIFDDQEPIGRTTDAFPGVRS